MSRENSVRIAFVCVENAGRSQMAAAFAAQERDTRGLQCLVHIISGGTQPAERVHDSVVTVMAEVGIDLANRTPRAIAPAELEEVDLVITIGCSAEEVCPAT